MSGLHVVFKVADVEYILPADDVLQMETFTGATRVPGTPDYVAGLIQVRGRVIPVVDLRARFGLPPVPTTLDTRVVVAKDGERTVGLIVDSAREVLDLPAEKLKPPPEVLVKGSTGFVKSIAQAGNRLVMLIDFKKVIGEGAHVER
jgi:purine-binding chemotaxis protein CheW